jgi:hypothetical protein
MTDSVMLLHRSLKDVVHSVLSEKIQKLTTDEKRCWQQQPVCERECAQSENWLTNLDPDIKLYISHMQKLINQAITVYFIIRRHLFQFRNEVILNFIIKNS